MIPSIQSVDIIIPLLLYNSTNEAYLNPPDIYTLQILSLRRWGPQGPPLISAVDFFFSKSIPNADLQVLAPGCVASIRFGIYMYHIIILK